MGRMSRTKGIVAEREVVNLLKDRGLRAQRTAPLQAAGTDDADVIGVEGFALEVKRCERVEIDKWCAQAALAARPTDIPAVVWRRNNQPWRVALSFEDFLDLTRRASL